MRWLRCWKARSQRLGEPGAGGVCWQMPLHGVQLSVTLCSLVRCLVDKDLCMHERCA